MEIKHVTFLVTEEREEGKFGALVKVDPQQVFNGALSEDKIKSMAKAWVPFANELVQKDSKTIIKENENART